MTITQHDVTQKKICTITIRQMINQDGSQDAEVRLEEREDVVEEGEVEK